MKNEIKSLFRILINSQREGWTTKTTRTKNARIAPQILHESKAKYTAIQVIAHVQKNLHITNSSLQNSNTTAPPPQEKSPSDAKARKKKTSSNNVTEDEQSRTSKTQIAVRSQQQLIDKRWQRNRSEETYLLVARSVSPKKVISYQ